METVVTLKGVTLSELSEETEVTRRRLKFPPLAFLILNHRINLVDLRHLGENETLIVLRGGFEGEGVASWAVRRYPPRLMEIIANTPPGVAIIDLAHRVNMPPPTMS